MQNVLRELGRNQVPGVRHLIRTMAYYGVDLQSTWQKTPLSPQPSGTRTTKMTALCLNDWRPPALPLTLQFAK